MSSYERSQEIVEKLQAAGIVATNDPRSATPPCVLVAPPERSYELSCGYVASWNLWVLAPGAGNADAHKKLDELADAVAQEFPIEHASFMSYVLSPESPALPAYRMQFDEGI